MTLFLGFLYQGPELVFLPHGHMVEVTNLLFYCVFIAKTWVMSLMI